MNNCLQCGQPMRQRSQPHHRLLFAVIQRAFDSWPESSSFQPADAEHLRAYLLVHASHYDKLDLLVDNPDAISLEDQIKAVLKGVSDKPTLVHTYPWGIRIFSPKSISYSEMGRAEFNRVCDKVFEIISEKLGVSIEQLKRESELEPA